MNAKNYVLYRSYALEFYTGSEPLRSKAARKSLAHSLRQYEVILNPKLHQDYYGLKSRLIVLFVFCSTSRLRHCLNLSATAPILRRGGLHEVTVEGLFPRFPELASKTQRLLALW